MEPHITDAVAGIDRTHWMYRLRAHMLQGILGSALHDRVSDPEILDIGCGSGGTTGVLCQFGSVTAVDPSEAARQWIARRLPEVTCMAGDIQNLGTLLPNRRFHVVTCFHVLYHRDVEDPASALQKLAEYVMPGGLLVLEEPADKRLIRAMDRTDSGVRRFQMEALLQWIEMVGLTPVQHTYLHGWAWPIARMLAWRDARRPDTAFPSELHDGLLGYPAYWLSRSELMLRRLGLALPVGTGCWIVARKKK